ncbi:hypothetical protein [Fluviicola sp.]|uniref:hypothetical protein n=1 Tax=Fluviicola sp. TaxID=1917219 RepID=UPI0031E2221B
MAEYEADKVIALLQFCSWKHRAEMNHTGLQKLRGKLVNFLEEADEVGGIKKKEERFKPPNDKYLIDLLSDSNVAVKKDNLIYKSKSHMNFLLEFGGFDSWETWEAFFYNANEFISSEGLNLSSFSALEIGICFPSQLEKKLLPVLSFTRKNSIYPLHLLPLSNEEIADQLAYPLTLLKEYPFVVWAIPVQWSNKPEIFDNPQWKELIQSKRILPVWIDESDEWELQVSSVPWLMNHQTIGGLRGVLCGLLYIHETIKQVHSHGKPVTAQSSPQEGGAPTQIQNFQHSRGVFLLGHIQSTNTAMGDITIHNHKNTKDEHTSN